MACDEVNKGRESTNEGVQILKVALLDKARVNNNEKQTHHFRMKLAAPHRGERKKKVRMAEVMPKPRD